MNKINRNSWHYRLFIWADGQPTRWVQNKITREMIAVPVSKCRYYQTVFWLGMVMPAILGLVLLGIAVLVLIPIIGMFGNASHWWPIVTFMVVGPTLIWGLHYLWKKFDHWKTDKSEKYYAHEDVGFFYGWWKTFKEKVCPPLEFTDD
jgi:hypothetical protein